MKSAAIILATAVALFTVPDVHAQRQINTWQDLGAYVGEQTEKLNENTAKLEALTIEYNRLLQLLVVLACGQNIHLETLRTIFPFIEPLPIGEHECPTAPVQVTIPQYIGTPPPLAPKN